MSEPAATSASVSFRLVGVNDAEYILKLRLHPELGRYLTPTDPSLEKQIQWLSEYKLRERAGTEYFYIIQNGATRCGGIRILMESDYFEPASVILDANKTPTASTEAMLFVYQLGFEQWGFDKSLLTVRKENIRAIRLYQRLGARIVGERRASVGILHLFEFNRSDWEFARKKYRALLPNFGPA